jgi:hypothetical protein
LNHRRGGRHAGSASQHAPRDLVGFRSNSALKLPSPKPSSPLRWMNSKKIGVVECAALTGETDYLLRVVVADMAHQQRRCLSDR